MEQSCPDSAYLCQDPGMLMCVGALNDCSGQGDCYKGSCYCHLGWGGKDCSVPACLANEGCSDVRYRFCYSRALVGARYFTIERDATQ